MFREAKRSMTIQTFPTNLIVQLLRFNLNTQHTFEKNSSAISFPSDQWNVTSGIGSRQFYELAAVSNHVGPTKNEGHCTAHCKDPTTGSRHHCDNITVSNFSVTTPTWSSTEAQLLFYTAVDVTDGSNEGICNVGEIPRASENGRLSSTRSLGRTLVTMSRFLHTNGRKTITWSQRDPHRVYTIAPCRNWFPMTSQTQTWTTFQTQLCRNVLNPVFEIRTSTPRLSRRL